MILAHRLISSMVDSARRDGSGDLLCLINADMIVMRDLVEAALKVRSRFDRFVMLGRRWDVDVDAPMDFSAGWESHLRAIVQQTGKLHRPAGSDFFVFPRSCYAAIPDFAVGRAGWDNWMIYKARQEGWPVIDCTPSVMIVHQNHDYSHLPGGVPHYSIPESNENIRLAGGQAPIRYTVARCNACTQEWSACPAAAVVCPVPSMAGASSAFRLLLSPLRKDRSGCPAQEVEEAAATVLWEARSWIERQRPAGRAWIRSSSDA